MRDTNQVVLVGRLTRDPEVRHSSSGVAVATFSIAVNRGAKQDGTDMGAAFPNIKCFGKLAELAGQYAFKGQKVFVAGRLDTNSFEKKDGTKGFMTEVLADTIEFMTRKTPEAIDSGKRDRADAAMVNAEIDKPGVDDDMIPEGFSKLDVEIPFD